MPLIPATSFPRELLRTLFLTNNIPTSTLQADPRIHYSAFIPDEHYAQSPDDATKLPLLVAIHGTSRSQNRHIDAWRNFAIKHRCAIVAPIFPCLLASPIDLDGYHYLGRPPIPDSPIYEKILESAVEVPKMCAQFGNDDIRYDLLLLALLDEVAIRWPGIDTSKILLTGFSGGGQFVHRFMYLHSGRLLAASVAAPGSATSLDFNKPWPAGLRDVQDIFGIDVDVKALQSLPILVSVGAEDKINKISKSRRLIMGDAFGNEEEVRKTRVQRATELAEQWRSAGLNVELAIVPGAKHEMEKVNMVVVPFMVKHLEK